MATRAKRSVKKASRRPTAKTSLRKQQLRLVTTYESITSLKTYPTNPRKGNVDDIAKSIIENDQYKPVTVQKSTRFVLAGNHTFMALKKLGYKEIASNVIDVDDERAKKIVIVDNKSSDDAEIDMIIMAELMSTMDNFEGTGYTDEEAMSILEMAQQVADEAASSVLDGVGEGEFDEDSLDDDDIELGSDDDVGPDDDDDLDRLEEAKEELSGAFQLADDVQYLKGAKTFFQIPPLRNDMLAQPDDLPKKLAAWAGTATRDNDDPDQWWLYNYGADSTSGMQQPINQVVISFYTHDEYFERWWGDPAKYVTKLLNSKISLGVMPDFSQWSEEPRIISLHNLYRNFWIARFMQEAGIRIIPNVSWRWNDREYLDKFVLPLYPKDLPLVAFQIQTFDHEQSKTDLAKLREMYRHVFHTLSPGLVLLYGGKAGKSFWESAKLQVKTRFIEHRVAALAEKAKTRERKTTL